MTAKSVKYDARKIELLILTIRGQKVILDRNLAALYGVPTFRFNEAVKRNRWRFPDDFAFQLTRQELTDLISHIAISSSGHGGIRKLPQIMSLLSPPSLPEPPEKRIGFHVREGLTTYKRRRNLGLKRIEEKAKP